MDRLSEAEKFLKFYQKKLNLTDWKLFVKLTVFNRTDYEQTGDIEVDLNNKSAVLLISEKDTGKNLNETVLHELVHLLLWELDQFAEENVQDKKQYLSLLEKTVDQITKSILNTNERH